MSKTELELVTVRLGPQAVDVLKTLIKAGCEEARHLRGGRVPPDLLAMEQQASYLPGSGLIVFRKDEFQLIVQLIELGKRRTAGQAGGSHLCAAVVKKLEERMMAVIRKQ